MSGRADRERARIDPAAVYAAPEEIVAAPDLTRKEKLDLLRRWRYDAIELNVAVDEGMGDESSSLLDRILRAIDGLEQSQ